jgi:hypothetical protein
MLRSSLSTAICDTGFTDRQSGHLPNWLAAPVLGEANELVAIAISSINTAKRNAEAEA